MKYVVFKGSSLFDSLIGLQKRIKSVNKAAFDLAATVRCTKIARGYNSIAGGISAFSYDSKPPLFVLAGKSWERRYYPRKCKDNKALLEKIHALPRVEYSELNELIGFKSQSYGKGRGITFCNCPGIHFFRNYVLVEVDEEAKYKPVIGMKEITVSEFNQLKKKK